MELKKLDISFYNDNIKVEQALDFDMSSGAWTANKVRGHGVVQITIHNLTFAIPVRSHIKHGASFILEVDRNNRDIKGMGLDYSKALLITNTAHISNRAFLLKSKSAGRKLVGKEAHVTAQFTKYVEKYIKAVQNTDNHILKSLEYRYTTLINYHNELKL
jgi:protein AbiQ